MTRTNLQLRSLVKASGELEVSLVDTALPPLGADDVLIRVEATPINPSDLGLLFSLADMSGAQASVDAAGRPVITARVPEGPAMRAVAARLDQSMPVGNEGAGTVVEAGSSPAAQALVGKKVAAIGGAMYSQWRVVPLAQCLELPEGATAAQGASSFVNPLTALGMVETMRREGHTALVHTAAASNLGQMLNRICIKDGVPLVNIVRKAEQAELLKGMGARHVCDSSSQNFLAELTDALAATGATIAFDAIGGGPLAGQILGCMEAAINRSAKTYSLYGSAIHKQVYIYGSLDRRPVEVLRTFGMAWGMGGWLLFPFLQKAGAQTVQRLKDRVAAELTTTFASHYSQEISLAQVLDLDVIGVVNQRATGTKYLIDPSR
ncbi:MAG: zinc-binding dehydrogenase, partial [Proteobacteria bacterium]|nr:zinc-binding dehydrogenase [Pseudomonadota bacterium]